MTRRKKVVSDPGDQTPIETDEDLPPPATPKDIPKPGKRRVEITQAGADALCWSEHGMHDTAGVVIDTTYADLFVSRGWAKEVD